MLHQVGVIKVRQLKHVTEIYRRLTSLPRQWTFGYFNGKLAKIRDRNINVAPNKWLQRLHNLMVKLKFTPDRPTPIDMTRKWLFLNREFAVARLCRILYQTLSHSNYMSQTFGTITTFLATVTKFWDSISQNWIINKTANVIYKAVCILFEVLWADDLKQQKSFYKHEHYTDINVKNLSV